MNSTLRLPCRRSFPSIIFLLLILKAVIPFCISKSTPDDSALELIADASFPNHEPLKENKRDLVSMGDKEATIQYVPSHIEMCKVILFNMNANDNTPKPVQIIKERKDTCENMATPHESLLQIFASSLLSEVARFYGINVWYHFDCTKDNQNSIYTVQQFLPSPIIVTDEVTQMSLPFLEQTCTRCVNNFDKGKISSPDCILYDQQHLLKPEKKDAKSNEVIQRRNLASTSSSYDNTPDLPHAIQYLLPSIKKNLMHAAHMTYQNPKVVKDMYHDVELNTVIYLGPADENDFPKTQDEKHKIADLYLPLHEFYALEIPRYVTQIEILTPPTCSECHQEGKHLTIYLRKLLPQTKVALASYTSSTTTFTKMMTAYQLICVNGETCLLPTFTRESYSLLALPSSSSNKQLLEKRNPLVNSIPTEQYPMKLKTVDMHNIHKHIIINGKCRHIRGRFGRWVQDLKFAKKLQYRTPLNHIYGLADSTFKPTEKQPYRKPTTYKWEASEFAFCGLDNLLTIEKFCDLLYDMDIQRIFMVGDSLQQSQAFSLWKVLGGKSDINLEFDPPRPNFTKEIKCPKKPVLFTYTRSDQIKENDHPVSVPEEIGNCSKYCYPWTESYRSHPGKTLLVASIGAHFYDNVVFQDSFNEFIRTIDSIARPQDIIFFRTTVPGHHDCNDKEIPNKKKPFDSWTEYQPTSTDTFSWDQFINYNNYAERILFERLFEARKLKLQDSMPQIELLDVYPMTVLRSDGHLGGEECTSELCAKSSPDCLHYNLPGPVDWWNHLMYNNLVDIAIQNKIDLTNKNE